MILRLFRSIRKQMCRFLVYALTVGSQLCLSVSDVNYGVAWNIG